MMNASPVPHPLSPAEIGRRLTSAANQARGYAVLLTDCDGVILSCSDGAQALIGYAPSEAVGQYLGMLYTGTDQQRGQPGQDLSAAIADGVVQEENWRCRKDGTLFWALSELVAIRDEQGNLSGFCETSRDLSGHKVLEDRLAWEKEHAQDTLAAIDDAVISFDRQGRIDFLNPKAEELTGWSADEARGRSLGEVLVFAPSVLGRSPLHDVMEYLNEGCHHAARSAAVLVSRAGTLHDVEQTGRPIHPADGSVGGGVIVVRDVTRRNEADSDLYYTDRRRYEFLAMLGHELRNPLAPIKSAAHLLSLNNADPASIKHASAVIGRQVGHMTHLIEDLLDVSRVTRGLVELHRRPTDMLAVIAGAVEQAGPLIHERGHCLNVQGVDEAVLVNGDEARLVQVLANLLTNAAKYTLPRGNIDLRMTATADVVVLAISDDGIGMSPEMIVKAFQPFGQGDRTPDRSQGGLGIGLALVRSLVELHGGTIEASSAGVGCGSVFTVSLRRMPSTGQSPPMPRPTRPGFRPGGSDLC